MEQAKIHDLVAEFKMENIIKHGSDYYAIHRHWGSRSVSNVRVVMADKYILNYQPEPDRIKTHFLSPEGSYFSIDGKPLDIIKSLGYIPAIMIVEDWKIPGSVMIDIVRLKPEVVEIELN